MRSNEDAAQRGRLTGLSRGGSLVCKLKENSLVTCPLAHGGSSVRKGHPGWRAEVGRGGLEGVSVLSLAGEMRRAEGPVGTGCCCSPGAGGHFEASPPENTRDGGCLHPQSPEQEVPAVPVRLNPGSAAAGWILVLPQALVRAPALVVSHLETASHQSILPMAFFGDHLKPRRGGDRGDWFIPL